MVSAADDLTMQPNSGSAADSMQVISLNSLKKGANNAYNRLEIPVALAKISNQSDQQDQRDHERGISTTK